MTTLSREQRDQVALASWRRLAIASLPDALMVIGSGSVAYGAWLVYAPAGFIVSGALLLIAGILAARSAAT